MPSNQFSLLRERAGLTIAEAARRIGCDIRTIYRWENGEVKPRKVILDVLENTAAQRTARSGAQGTLFDFVDLFSGVGGMRIAFDAVGGKCVASCEIDKYCRETYAANFPLANHPFYEDIREITKDGKAIKQIPDHDVLIAGFPCQPFSIAGVSKKKALGDPHGFACEAQGTLFFDIARILRIKRPRAFLLENVKNLVSHDGGRTFKVIIDVLRKQLGYEFVSHRIIDAKRFLPQHRERTFIVGFAKHVDFSWDAIKLPDRSEAPRLKQILHNEAELADGKYTLGHPFRVNPKYTLTNHLWSYLRNYAEKHRAAGNGFGFGLVGPEDVARTLSARYYKDGSEILVYQGKRKPPRRLTPRECSRLMGFDRPEREFNIVVSDTQAYKQFGNAVAVPVVEAVARAMVDYILEQKEDQIEPRLPFFRAREPDESLTQSET
jgi:DNA (cytosine-5)-methyltransferase 1